MSEPPRITVDYAAECNCPNDHTNGELDEFVADGVNIHFEMMDSAQFWMRVEDPASGRSWHLNFGAVNPRARGYSLIEEDQRTPINREADET